MMENAFAYQGINCVCFNRSYKELLPKSWGTWNAELTRGQQIWLTMLLLAFPSIYFL